MLLSKQMHGTTFNIDLNEANVERLIGYMRTEEYLNTYNEVIQGYHDKDLMTKEDIIKDVDALEAKFNSIKEGAASVVDELFDKLALKKNNRINRKVKPTIHGCPNGYYVDECYGWYGYVLRIVPVDETNATLILETIITHY